MTSLTVAVTLVAGLLFCWLRLRSRSLLAPVLAHLATNTVAFTAVWVVLREADGAPNRAGIHRVQPGSWI